MWPHTNCLASFCPAFQWKCCVLVVQGLFPSFVLQRQGCSHTKWLCLYPPACTSGQHWPWGLPEAGLGELWEAMPINTSYLAGYPKIFCHKGAAVPCPHINLHSCTNPPEHFIFSPISSFHILGNDPGRIRCCFISGSSELTRALSALAIAPARVIPNSPGDPRHRAVQMPKPVSISFFLLLDSAPLSKILLYPGLPTCPGVVRGMEAQPWCMDPVALVSPSMCLKQSHTFIKESLGTLLLCPAPQCFQQWHSQEALSLWPLHHPGSSFQHPSVLADGFRVVCHCWHMQAHLSPVSVLKSTTEAAEPPAPAQGHLSGAPSAVTSQ